MVFRRGLIRTVERGRALDWGIDESFRFRIGVGIVRRIGYGAATWPKAAATDLVRIGLACDSIGKIGNAAGMGRGEAAKVGSAPEVMHQGYTCRRSARETS